MIPTLLQDCLVDEMKVLFNGILFKNEKNEKVPLNVYPQNLPVKKNPDDDNHFPFLIIRIADGEGQDEESDDTCRILFIAGICDDDEKYQGYKDIANIIEKIRQHLFRQRVFDSKYEIVYPYNWAIQDDDEYPHYFGGIDTNWIVPKVITDDDNI